MITFTQGDTATLQLTAQDGAGNPINLTGASFTTQILGMDGVSVVFPNSQHTITDAVLGQFTLSLSSDDTDSCGNRLGKSILTTITQGSTVITYRGYGILTVYQDVPPL